MGSMKKPVPYYRELAGRYIASAQAMGNIYGIERDAIPGKRTISLFGANGMTHMKEMPEAYRPLAEGDFDGWAA